MYNTCMEPQSNKIDEQLYQEWMNRPGAILQLGFGEWKAERIRGLLPGSLAGGSIPAPLEPASRPRHESGKMNKLEAKYAAHLELRKTT